MSKKDEGKVGIGPVYGVPLIDTMPLGKGGFLQQMPDRSDLIAVKRVSERTVAGYEVLLNHYRDRTAECERLKDALRQVIEGTWSVTELQELLGVDA